MHAVVVVLTVLLGVFFTGYNMDLPAVAKEILIGDQVIGVNGTDLSPMGQAVTVVTWTGWVKLVCNAFALLASLVGVGYILTLGVIEAHRRFFQPVLRLPVSQPTGQLPAQAEFTKTPEKQLEISG